VRNSRAGATAIRQRGVDHRPPDARGVSDENIVSSRLDHALSRVSHGFKCGARWLNEKGPVLHLAIADMVLAVSIMTCTLTQSSRHLLQEFHHSSPSTRITRDQDCAERCANLARF
jgi:hypothetical protein